MNTLHLYLTRQVLIALLFTVLVFAFLFLLGNAMKEVLALLVTGQGTMDLVGRAIGLLLPYVMAYVLPFGLLTAVLLALGRFSADQELTAVRASGISLFYLVIPIILLSLILCAVCALFNLWIAPQCRTAYKNLIYEYGKKSISNLITEDRFIDEIPGMILYVRRKYGNKLEDVRIYMLQTNEIFLRISAEGGQIVLSERSPKIRFELSQVLLEARNDRRLSDEPLIGPPPPDEPLEWVVAKAGIYSVDVDLTSLKRDVRKPRVSEMTIVELFRERSDREALGIDVMPLRVQIHRQIGFSFACFAFTLVAIPLAIQAHRRETSIGIAIALVLVIFYYSFLILAESLATKTHLHPHLIVWIPNILFEVLGAVLLYRSNRR